MVANVFVSALALGALVTVHEIGHFLMALLMGVKVGVFSVGFGKPLWKREFRGTEYRFSLIPLGGYVGILNDNSENAINGKPAWKKGLIAFAGPMANLLLAFFIFSLINFSGGQTPSTAVQTVNSGSPASKAGIVRGDRILGAPGNEFENWDELIAFIGANPSTPIALNILKSGGEVVVANITPDAAKGMNAAGEEITVGKIGISPEMDGTGYGLAKSVYLGGKQVLDGGSLIVRMLFKMLSNQASSGTIAGPLMILKMTGEQADAGLLPLLMFAAMLSLNLAIFNLLPVPALDGGEILLLMIEGVKGSPISEKKAGIFQKAGIAFMASLFVYAFYNDIIRLIS